jgi:hypothetical protein
MFRACPLLVVAVAVAGCDLKPGRFAKPVATTTPAPAPVIGPAQPPPEPAPVQWARLTESVTIGDVRVTCLEAGVSRVKLQDPINGGETDDEDESFWVWLRIDNLSETKILRYTSWGNRSGTSLTDEHGNKYRSRRDALTMPVGAVSSADVRPSQSATDALLFEKPVDAAQRFRLHLRHPTGGLEPFRFELTREDFRRK